MAFQDGRSWELISNWDPLVVTVPDLFDHANEGVTKSAQQMGPVPVNRPPRTFVVIVSGNGAWDFRGLHFYNSWHDMMTAGCGAPMYPTFACNSLQYQQRTSTPFRTLDHMDELGLEVSTNGGTEDDSYPNWHHHKTLPTIRKDMKEKVAMWSNPPPTKDIPALALATMAITKFASIPNYCQATDRGTRFVANAVQIEIDLTAEGRPAGSVIATVQRRDSQDTRGPQNQWTKEEMDDTMSAGKGNCNFCQKPKGILKREGKKLKACGRCDAIYYCSKPCQQSDWIRHKKDCRPVARSDESGK